MAVPTGNLHPALLPPLPFGLPTFLLGCLVAVVLAACGGDSGAGGWGTGESSARKEDRADPPPDREPRLLVLAASDLVHALPEIVEEFQARTGTGVDLVLGSSGNLATQIENGAPADLYFSANRHFLDRLEGRGRLVPGTRRDYAVGRLALIAAPGTAPPAGLAELAGREFQVIALANPEHAPYGMAAREALQAQGLWDGLASRLVYAENIAQATQFVRTGNADAGIVALGVILGERNWDYRLIPDHLHAPLLQAAAVIQGSRHEVTARRLLEFVLAAEGQTILARYGFEPAMGGMEP
jgi:molybdate transport system substrate-binding protein